MQALFKSKVEKFEDPCYKIIDPPRSLNEGNYRVNYEPIDKKEKMVDLKERERSTGHHNFYNVPPCVAKTTECTYHSRKQAKLENGKQFNSIFQMADTYFVKRG